MLSVIERRHEKLFSWGKYLYIKNCYTCITFDLIFFTLRVAIPSCLKFFIEGGRRWSASGFVILNNTGDEGVARGFVCRRRRQIMSKNRDKKRLAPPAIPPLSKRSENTARELFAVTAEIPDEGSSTTPKALLLVGDVVGD